MTDERSWQTRAVEATRGNQSQLGAILVAVLGRRPSSGRMCFDSTATITSDGFVMCGYTDKNGGYHMGALVCSVRDLRDNFRGLADHLKLTDKEREDMFSGVRQWITTDYRSDKQIFGNEGSA